MSMKIPCVPWNEDLFAFWEGHGFGRAKNPSQPPAALAAEECFQP